MEKLKAGVRFSEVASQYSEDKARQGVSRTVFVFSSCVFISKISFSSKYYANSLPVVKSDLFYLIFHLICAWLNSQWSKWTGTSHIATQEKILSSWDVVNMINRTRRLYAELVRVIKPLTEFCLSSVHTCIRDQNLCAGLLRKSKKASMEIISVKNQCLVLRHAFLFKFLIRICFFHDRVIWGGWPVGPWLDLSRRRRLLCLSVRWINPSTQIHPSRRSSDITLLWWRGKSKTGHFFCNIYH